MEDLGNDFNMTGSVMTKHELEEARRKRGECLTCGRKCFQKRYFKMIPITDHGLVLNGRCLKCKPLEPKSDSAVLPAVSRPATQEDLARFNQSRRNLGTHFRRQDGPRRPNSATSVAASDGSRSGGGSNIRRGMSADVAHRRESGSNTRRDSGNHMAQEQRHASMHEAYSPRVNDGRQGYSREPAPGGGSTGRGHTRRPASESQSQQRGSSRSVDSSASESSRGRPASSDGGAFDRITETVTGTMAAQMLQQNFRERHPVRAEGAPAAAADPYQHNIETSSRSLNSSRIPDPIPEVAPRRQMLDRGGAVTRKPPSSNMSAHSGQSEYSDAASSLPPMMAVKAESQRTLDSISSVGDATEDDADLNGHEYFRANSHASRNSSRQTVGYDSYRDSQEQVERKRSARKAPATESEQVALRTIQNPDSNYRDILQIMQGHMSSMLIQQESLKELSNLQLMAQDQQNIAALGGLGVIVDGMKAHPSESEVQICGCRAIWNLSGSTRNQVGFAEAGAIGVILRAMDEFPGNAEVQEKAMAALSNLAAAEANQSKFLEGGGVKNIIDAMSRHSEDVQVQQKACAAITNLASYDLSVKKAITEHGGAGTVVISMIMHPNDVDLQEKALRALRNICANDDENKVLVAGVGGIDAVISAMQVHRDEPGVQEAGAWTLSNLAVNADNKAIIGDSGGIDVIVRAMWVHSDNAGVQEWACRALWTLSVDPTNKNIVTEVGGISAVVNAMQAHVDEATVQEKGCGVLSNLAANDDNNKVRIVEEEALDAIVMAMVLHSDNGLVQDRACTVLKKLAFGPNIKPMQAANVSELVRVAADKFPDQCGEKARHILALV